MDSLLPRITSRVTSREIAELASSLIRIPSHWDVPTKEEEVVQAVASFLTEEKIPFKLQRVEGSSNNIIATIKGKGGGRSLALSGHLDTVPPYDMEIDPFTAKIEEGKIYGRGAVDMKGPVAAMLMTLAAYRRSGIPLKGDLIFAGVLAEETNSDGSETLIRSGFRTDGAIVGEPSDREYAIGHRGLEWIEVEFFGKTAHGGVPQDGINAIVHAARFINRVQENIVPKLARRDHPHMGPSVMNFGRIEGGTQPSTVGDRCVVKMDRRYISSESLEEVIAEYQEVLDELSREDPTFRAELKLMDLGKMAHFYHAPLETSPDAPIVKAVVDSIREVSGIEPRLTTRRGWTDAAIFGHFGKIPTVVFGPGSLSRSHSKAEFITLDELEEGFKTYVSIAIRFCGMA